MTKKSLKNSFGKVFFPPILIKIEMKRAKNHLCLFGLHFETAVDLETRVYERPVINLFHISANYFIMQYSRRKIPQPTFGKQRKGDVIPL